MVISKEKTDSELSIEAAFWKLKKEIDLITESENLKFLLNNLNYNCNVYMLKVHLNIELNLIESEKNGEWEKFFFETYKRIAREGQTTPIHTMYIELILYRIKLKPESLKKKAIKQSKLKRIL